jgi:hypothetical protein
MRKVVIVCIVLFACLILYSIGLYTVDVRNDFWMVLFTVLPLSLSLTFVFSWLLKTLQSTIQQLEIRRQMYKIAMFKWLYRVLMTSAILMLVFMVGISIVFQQRTNDEWYATNWTYFWFLQGKWH